MEIISLDYRFIISRISRNNATTLPATPTSIEEANNADLAPTPALIVEDNNTPPQNGEFGNTWEREADGMTLVYVPSGTFLMGNDDGRNDEKPTYEVTLDSFWIDRTEVANRQYTACINAGECQTYEEYDGNYHGLYPVVGISWHDARTYCEWVNARLPNEAEWEYAARGPDNNTYPWGNESPTCDLLNFYDDGDCVGGTSIVGSYSPQGDSWVGASDMAGNVWEWVNDWYSGNYYANSSAENPTGPADGTTKVIRSGSWNRTSSYVRSSYRSNLHPTNQATNIGFRCVMSGN